VQLRAGLEFSSQQHQGKSFVVVKDPVTARYFRFTESQAIILELLRDPIDAETLAARASERLSARVPVATIEGFLKSLEDKWLLDSPEVQEKLAAVEARKKFSTGCCRAPDGLSRRRSTCSARFRFSPVS
jgi:hypothetical protein